MKFFYFISAIVVVFAFSQCRSGRIIQKAIKPRDTTKIVQIKTLADTVSLINETKQGLQKSNIDFKTFSAKIRLDIETSDGVQPDAVANVRIIKDSLIWISITATFLNFEVLRIYISKDSVIVLDKRKHQVKYRTFDYLQEITNIPFDFKTIQDVIIGNPIFINKDSMTVKKYDTYLLIASLTDDFKNLTTLSLPDNLLEHCKLDDRNINQNRTADFTYGYYTNVNGTQFSTYRQIVVTEKNKLDVRMTFKQYDFNKDLSINFSVPKSYKKN